MDINAELIKTSRTNRNWTQQHLAEACGVSLRTIQRVERYGNASNETVMALASVLEVEQSDIIVPETPVVELELTDEPSLLHWKSMGKFVMTLVTGMMIGAAVVVFLYQ